MGAEEVGTQEHSKGGSTGKLCQRNTNKQALEVLAEFTELETFGKMMELPLWVPASFIGRSGLTSSALFQIPADVHTVRQQ